MTDPDPRDLDTDSDFGTNGIAPGISRALEFTYTNDEDIVDGKKYIYYK